MNERDDETGLAQPPEGSESLADDLDAGLEEARENVFDGWPALVEQPETESPLEAEAEPAEAEPADVEPVAAEPADVEPLVAEPVDAAAAAPADEPVEPNAAEPFSAETPEQVAVDESATEHAPGELAVPPGYSVLEGGPNGSKRAVGVVVARFNGDVTTRLLEDALEELERAGVGRDAITVMPVPGAFELPLAAMALAKTRRYAAVVALGCVIRGDTPHFDYIASEAASGLQLAALETGVPVAFGVLTLESAEQADERIGKGSEAVRTALEMADLFANLRAAATR